MYEPIDAETVIGYTELCPKCGEEVYEGMMWRHEAKDHDPEDEQIYKLYLEYGVDPGTIYEVIYG